MNGIKTGRNKKAKMKRVRMRSKSGRRSNRNESVIKSKDARDSKSNKECRKRRKRVRFNPTIQYSNDVHNASTDSLTREISNESGTGNVSIDEVKSNAVRLPRRLIGESQRGYQWRCAIFVEDYEAALKKIRANKAREERVIGGSI